MTFWYGLRQSESAYIDVASGNYNTAYVRLNCLLVVLSLQLFQLWNFTSFHVGRFKESASRKSKTETKRLTPQPKAKKVKADDSISETEQADELDGNLKKGKKKTN
ncbi:hypothetical protein TELCIR_18428 [Teladorsagia circumcincta]|uniref:TLC domain-containing protein n=1 Tax=Teladorsagia circumcincta TaxID=45464 RepID=A0A2G9TQ24_TELCI|nr:hypothetical protein TELCIR_18428 [Teladorsagia circumcincta]